MSEFTLLELHLHDGPAIQWGPDGAETPADDPHQSNADGGSASRALLVVGLAAVAVALKRRDGGLPADLEALDDRIGD